MVIEKKVIRKKRKIKPPEKNDDILTGFVKGMGYLTLTLVGTSFLALMLLTRKKGV